MSRKMDIGLVIALLALFANVWILERRITLLERHVATIAKENHESIKKLAAIAETNARSTMLNSDAIIKLADR